MSVRNATILIGDVSQRIDGIPDRSVQCCVTSPPYWGLRDYGHAGQIGLENSPAEFIAQMVKVFDGVRRILKDDGVAWINLGDTYATDSKGTGGESELQNGNKGSRFAARRLDHGVKNKDLIGIPWRVAFALQDAGWWLRQDIIWHKPNPMPESVGDRCTKGHEYFFMMAKSRVYYFDSDQLKEPAVDKTVRNKRSVWSIPVAPFKGAHFAVMPEKLVEFPILATSRPGDVVFDPFTGSGTVAAVALRHGRDYLGCELNPDYAQIARKRIEDDQPLLNTVNVQ